MPYSITTTSGAPVATVQDATINTTSTALTLIGRDYAGYGAFLNENFIHLMENFASNADSYGNPTSSLLYNSSTDVTKALTGQLWYDTSVNTLKVWNESLDSWRPVSSTIALGSTPSGLYSAGDLWFDTQNNQLYAYNDGWQPIGPEVADAEGATSGAKVERIQDSSDAYHTIIKLYIRNVAVGIISSDSEFTPKTSINGFTTIKPGYNLAGSSAVADAKYNGDASNALALNGITSSQFLRSDQPAVTAYSLNAGNLTVGSALALNEVASNNEVQIQSLISDYDLNIYANYSGTPLRAIGISGSTGGVTVDNALAVSGAFVVSGTTTLSGTITLGDIATLQNKIIPDTDGIDIGATATKFANVHATYFNGIHNGNVSAQQVIVGNVIITSNAVTIGGNSIATQSYVTGVINTAGKNSQGTKIISTSPPSGTGTNGDIWYQV